MVHYTFISGCLACVFKFHYGFSAPHICTLYFARKYLWFCFNVPFSTLNFLLNVHDDYLMVGYVLRIEALSDNNGLADTWKLFLKKTLWIHLPYDNPKIDLCTPKYILLKLEVVQLFWDTLYNACTHTQVLKFFTCTSTVVYYMSKNIRRTIPQLCY